MITDEELFPALNSKFEFIAMDKNPKLMVVRKHWHENGEMSSCRGLLRVQDIDIDILKRHKLWDNLSEEVRKEIENLSVEEKEVVNNRLEKARGARKNKYANVPRELVCITCGNKSAIPPGALVKRVEKIAEKKGILFTIDDFLKVYQCQECHPTKGRPRGSGVVQAPTELVCKCGAKISVSPSILNKRIEKLGITLEKYVKGYQCQKCHPTKGRKSNPDNAHLPKELVCKCGKQVKSSPSAIIAAAGRKKITPEEYVKKYRCQTCCPTKGRHKKGKGKK